MPITQVEYLGFRSGETSRDYRLLVRHNDGHCDEFTLTIAHEAFLAHRVRYQDAAEICFTKLRKALAAWESAPDSARPAARQTVTEADLLEYREEHAAKPPRRKNPQAIAAAAAAAAAEPLS